MYSGWSNRPKRSGSSAFSSSITTATLSSARARCGGNESSAFRTCSAKVVTSVGRLQRPALLDELDEGEAEHEAPDVREEGDAAALLRVGERDAAVDQLEDEPDAEEQHRGHLAQDEEDDRQHLRAREEQQVGAQHGRDGAARADVRDRRLRVAREAERDERLQGRRRESPGEVE